jgi:hypothetical protein
MLEALDLSRITDPDARRIVDMLVQIIEAQAAEIALSKETVQQLRDEVARLKGEQGKPTIRRQPPQRAHSSELERPADPRPPHPRAERRLLVVDREEVCRVDRGTLPPDATFKGHEPFVVQDVVLRTDTVRYLREKWYAGSTGRTYLADLPAGISDHFGPQVKALALMLYHVSGVSEPKIREVLSSVGLPVAAGTLSQWLTAELKPLHGEAEAVYRAGLASGPWQQIDDTSTRVNGVNHHCQVVCNPLYTSYHTTPAKDRRTVIDVLRPGQEGTYLINARALDWLAQVGVSARVREQVGHLPQDQVVDHATLDGWLATLRPPLGPQQRSRLYDATALAAYQAQTAVPVVDVLVCDDAGQFVGVTRGRALCWVHDARHYKKLTPVVPENQARLRDFMTDYWAFYGDLLRYRERPCPQEAARLRAAFTTLFSTTTGYPALDERIALTRAHQQELLLVLDHPELPLHNNRSELGARRRVRKRDVSFGPRTPAGAKAWDTLQTLAATAQQHGVNVLQYLADRVSGACQMPSLARLVAQGAATLMLGASWDADPATPPF